MDYLLLSVKKAHSIKVSLDRCFTCSFVQMFNEETICGAWQRKLQNQAWQVRRQSSTKLAGVERSASLSFNVNIYAATVNIPALHWQHEGFAFVEKRFDFDFLIIV